MSITDNTTTETTWQLARKYSEGDYQIYFKSNDIEAITEHMAKLMAARPWANMHQDLMVLKVTTTTTTQEIL